MDWSAFHSFCALYVLTIFTQVVDSNEDLGKEIYMTQIWYFSVCLRQRVQKDGLLFSMPQQKKPTGYVEIEMLCRGTSLASTVSVSIVFAS